MSQERIVDLYTHIMPSGYMDKFQALAVDRGLAKRFISIPMLYDIEARRRMMGQWECYQQILSPTPPGLERMGEAKDRPALSRFVNEGLAELCRKYPDEFPAFTAVISLDDVDTAIVELEYAVKHLGARGVQLFTNVLGKPLDRPEFDPLFKAIVDLGIVVLLHPTRAPSFADYPTEDRSEYEIWQVIGWPYDTAACIARLVFSGVMDRYPDLKIVTHHLGGIIPYLEGRISWEQLGSRTDGELGEKYENILKSLKMQPIEYFRRIYGDTAVCGSSNALRCGLAFFGENRVLFGSDCPFDPEGGPSCIRDALRALDELELDHDTRMRIKSRNTLSLMRIK